MKRLVLFISLLLLVFNVQAQFPRLSGQAEISIITIGPGANLYDSFGHGAIRIQDPYLSFDRAYNYGTFDSFEDGFYVKFAQGKLNYRLVIQNFKSFLGNYQVQNRWITEQVLDLSQIEKQEIFDFLENNAIPENSYYLYDFFYDNCATKLRDVVSNVLVDKLKFNNDHLTEEKTFRDLIQENTFNFPWWDFGIDIALGAVIDVNATPAEHMFLPDYIMQAYANATITRDGQEVPAVKRTNKLFESDYYETHRESITPWMVFSFLLIFVVVFTYKDTLQNTRARYLDFTILFLTGLVGLVVALLWFATDHTATAKNLNLLWAFVPNLVVAFFVVKRNAPAWTRSYVRLLFIMLIGMSFIWIFQLEVFSIALVPIMLLLAVRYAFLWVKGLA
ncbi:lipoprotein N-acyltransferase Lnb domain-containing protein [Roseivirga echinicomitans]